MLPIIFNLASKILGSGPPQDNSPAQIHPTTTTRSNAELDKPGSERVGSRKRAAAEGELGQSGPKKRRLYTGHAQESARLTGDYDTRKGAVPIPLPRGEGDMVADVPHLTRNTGMAVGRLSKRGRGGVQPQNSLDQQPHAVKGVQSYRGHGPMSIGQPQTTSNRGLSSTTHHLKPGDGFEYEELEYQPRSKRLKLEFESSLPARRSGPVQSTAIDLTSNDKSGQEVMESKVVKLNGKPIRDGRTSRWPLPALSSPARPFENNEFENVNEKVRMTEKRPRKAKEGRPSDQGSSRGTPVTSHASPRPLTSVPDHDVMEIRAIHPHGQQKPESKHHANGSDPKSKLCINLTEGWKEMPPQSSKPGPKNELIAIDRATDHSKEYPFVSDRKARSEQRPTPRQPRRQIPQEATPERAGSGDGLAHPQQDIGKTRRLSDTFVRDHESPLPREIPAQTKAPLRSHADRGRKALKRGTPDENGSADELAGDTTILPAHKRAASDDLDTLDRRAGGTYALKKSAQKKRSAKQKEDFPDESQVPIRAFYAATCMMDSDGLRLEHSPSDHTIYLYHGDDAVVTPGRDRLVAISEQEVRKVSWDKNYEQLKVCIQGPIGDISNGYICIVFDAVDHVKWAVEALRGVTKDQLRMHGMETESVETTFKTYRSYIDHGAQQTARKLQASADNAAREIHPEYRQIRRSRQQTAGEQMTPASQRSLRTRGHTRHHDQYNEDHIIYEYEEPLPMTRSRMLKEELISQVAPEISPYFIESHRRSGRERAPSRKLRTPTPPEKWTRINKPNMWSQSVVYPTLGANRVTVDFQDLERLDEDEFLNDNIVGFAIRQIEENMPREHRDNVFFFNTFFYTALSTKDGRKAFNYDAVKRWTKKTDLMSTRYVVVPINVHLHWFVAIICNLPNIARKASALEIEDVSDDEKRISDSDDEQNASGNVDQTDKAEFSQSTDAMEHLTLSDANKSPQTALDDVEELARKTSSRGRKTKKKRKAPPPKQYKANTPIIITLDSLGGAHTVELRYLKDYIIAEALEKRGMEVSRDEIQGMTAKGIPQQVNFSDCGVYVVRYLEQFAKDPQSFVASVLSRDIGKEAEFASFNPSAKRDQIRNDLLQLQKEQQEARHDVKQSAKTTRSIAPGKAEQPSHPDPALLAHGIQERADHPKAVLEKASSEAAKVGPTTASLRAPRAASLPAVSSQGGDHELQTALPRALGQRAGEQTEGSSQLPRPQSRHTEDGEMLDFDMEPLQRELMRHAQPPAEVPDSQEEL